MKLVDEYCEAEKLQIPSILPERDAAFRGLAWNGTVRLSAVYDFVRLVKLEQIDFRLSEKNAHAAVVRRCKSDFSLGAPVMLVSREQMAAYLRGLYGSEAALPGRGIL